MSVKTFVFLSKIPQTKPVHKWHTLYCLSGAGQIPQTITVPNVNLTNTTVPFAGSAISRQARRLYVGNMPFGVTEVSFVKW